MVLIYWPPIYIRVYSSIYTLTDKFQVWLINAVVYCCMSFAITWASMNFIQ